MKEQLKHKEAFEIYYLLGDKRDLKTVAKQVGVGERTIYRWSSAFDWQERVTQRDILIAEKVEEKVVDDIVSKKAKYSNLVTAFVQDVINQINKREWPFKIESPQDLERMIKLDLILLGEPDGRQEIKGEPPKVDVTVKIEEYEEVYEQLEGDLSTIPAEDEGDNEGDDT